MDITTMNRSQQLETLGKTFSRLGKGLAAEYGEDMVCVTPVLDRVLLIIGADETINIKRIAAMLLITSGAATQHVAALEKLGAVRRIISPDDRREIHVELTAEGLLMHKQIEANSMRIMHDIFQEFTDNEVATFVQLMDKASKRYEIKAKE